MSMQSEEINTLFQQYLAVCNQAMESHKEVFPYKHIWEAAEQTQCESGVHLTVYDDEPKGDYQIKIADKHIEVLAQKMPQNKAIEQMEWRVNTSYLKQVIADPEAYINDPAKLNWMWMKKPKA